MSKRMITIPLDEIPGAITESIVAVLRAHGYVLVQLPSNVTLFNAEHERVFDELGRNAAQCLVALEGDEHTTDHDDVITAVDHIVLKKAGE